MFSRAADIEIQRVPFFAAVGDAIIRKNFPPWRAVDADIRTFDAAGGVFESSAAKPNMPGWSLHETGTCRMGNDPKHFVTNRFGQTHDVPNLYVCDASVFPNSTDKTTTLSILAFSLRTSEYLLQNFNQRVHRRA